MDNNPNKRGMECLMVPVGIEPDFIHISGTQQAEVCEQVDKAKKLQEEGKYKHSLQLFQEAYETLTIVAPEHEFSLFVRTCVGVLLWRLKNYDDALKIFNEVYENMIKIGADTSELLYNKALVLYADGKYEEIYEINRKVYSVWENKYGFDHTATLMARHNIAFTLHAQYKFNEALKIYKEVYEIGVKNPEVSVLFTTLTQHNMAVALKEQGNLHEALTNFQDVFEKRKIAFGLNHRGTLNSWQELESVLAKLEKCERLEIYEHFHNDHGAAFGVDNEDALFMLEKTADKLVEQSEFVEAYCRYYKLYEMKKKKANNSEILNIQTKIGLLLLLQEKGEEALEILEDVYKKKSDIFGINHSDTLIVQYNIAKALYAQSKLDKSLETFSRVYLKSAEILGINCPRTIDALESKALVLARQRKYDEALKLYKQVYCKRLDIWGPDNEKTLLTGRYMAYVHVLQENYQEAHEIFCTVLKIQRQNNDPSRLLTWRLMADMFTKQGRYYEALQTYEKILSEKTLCLEPYNLDILRTCIDLASVLSTIGKLDDALQVLENTLVKTKNKLGPKHIQTLTVQLNIAAVLRKLGKSEEALNIYKNIKHISKDAFINLQILRDMARVLKDQGKYEAAANVLTDVPHMHIPNLPENLDTLQSIANLSINLCKYNTALEILNKIYSAYENTFGSENLKTLDIQSRMAAVRLKLNE